MMLMVSVIVSTYRRDSSLYRALESLALQTYSSFEIILVDDNSHYEWNIKVRKVLDLFQKNYPNIQIKFIVIAAIYKSSLQRT